MKRLVALTALTLAPFVVAAPALAAAPKPMAYANCTALHKVYPHGVAKAKGTVDKTSGVKVTNFTVDAKTYALNTKSDRDKDGIACEKR